MTETKFTIIGTGVVGLSIASSLSENYSDIAIIEKNDSFGKETSSRSSEVIHASIYYPKNSLKGSLCLQGNEMMYEICKKNNIPHINTGKLIVATNDEEESKLPALLETAKNNGAKGVRIVTKSEIARLEPNVNAQAAIYCPTSGIVDSHSLMQYFEAKAINSGASFIYNHKVIGLEKTSDAYIITAESKDSEVFKLKTKYLINSSGHNSGIISAMLGIDINQFKYKINFVKGMYFRIFKKLERFPKMLIYPYPPAPGFVGIHTTPDTAGGMRLGPYDVWVDEIDYSVDESFREFFYNSVKPFLPFLSIDELHPDSSGIHPKIQNQGEPYNDFVIRQEADKGLENFINLVGIESPGLTSSPAIGEYVKNIINELE